MAFDYFGNFLKKPEDEDQQNGQQTVPSSQSGIITGTSGVGDPSNPQKGTSSGAFTNLQSYLDANRDQNFGTQVADKVQGVVDEAGLSQQQTQDSFKNKVDTNTVKYDQGLVDRALADPRSFSGNAEDVSKFTNLRDAQYKGPISLTDEKELYDDVSYKSGRAKSLADATQTEEGRFGLLDEFYSRPTYTRGEKTLDNLLLQTDETAKPKFQNVQQAGNTANQKYSDLLQQLDSYAGDAQQTTSGTNAKTREALGIDSANNLSGNGAIGGLQKEVSDALAKRQAQYDSTVPVAQQALRSRDLRNLSPEVRQALGLDSYESTIYDVDPANFLRAPNRTDFTTENVATTDQQARMAALAKLAGIENSVLPDAQKAGTMDDEALFNFDKAGFEGAVSGRAAALTSATKALDAQEQAVIAAATEYNRRTGQPPPGSVYQELDQIRRQREGIQATFGITVANNYGKFRK